MLIKLINEQNEGESNITVFKKGLFLLFCKDGLKNMNKSIKDE